MGRVIGWFSCGIASATAIKIALDKHREEKDEREFIIAYTEVKEEHPDSMRFLKECEKWYGQKILILGNDKYGRSVHEVVEKFHYMSGVNGARCTLELKKNVRKKFQLPGDTHIMGFTIEEAHRIDQLLDGEPELEIYTPLIDNDLTKSDCFDIFNTAGIDIPEMYKLGYHNNNCIGCLKAGGAGYWNKIRQDFPETFDKIANYEYMLNVSLVKMSFNKFKRNHPKTYKVIIQEEEERDGEILKVDSDGNCRVPLRHLPVDAGDHKDLDIGNCGFFCEMQGFNFSNKESI